MIVKLREGSFPALDVTLPLVTAHWSGVLIIIFSERQDELVSLMKKGDKKCGAHCIWYCIVLYYFLCPQLYCVWMMIARHHISSDQTKLRGERRGWAGDCLISCRAAVITSYCFIFAAKLEIYFIVLSTRFIISFVFYRHLMFSDIEFISNDINKLEMFEARWSGGWAGLIAQ